MDNARDQDAYVKRDGKVIAANTVHVIQDVHFMGNARTEHVFAKPGFNGKHCTLPACNPIGAKQRTLCSGHGSCESSFTHNLMSNNPGSKDSMKDGQYFKRIEGFTNKDDIDRPEYR